MLTLSLAPASAAERSSRDWSIGYQLDPGHTGLAVADSLRPPLVPMWGVKFTTPTGEVAQSYPVIVRGRVYVTANAGGTVLAALDLYTGKPSFTPRVVGLGGAGGVTYDRGMIVTGDAMGFITGVSPRSGRIRWRAALDPSNDEGSAPTASHGRVVEANGRYAAALSVRSGRPVWVRLMPSTVGGIPALAMHSVFLSDSINETWRLAADTGMPLWEYLPGWSAGIGDAIAVAHGRAYVRSVGVPNHSVVLDTGSGRTIGRFQATTPVAVDGTRLFSADCLVDVDCPNDYGYQVQARNADGSMAWTFDGSRGGTLAPLVANGIVWIVQTGGSSTKPGSLIALDEASGHEVWRSPLPEWNAGGRFGPDVQMPGIAIAGGWLVVNDGGMLVAFAPRQAEPTVDYDHVRWQPRRLGSASTPVTVHLRDTGASPLSVPGLSLEGSGRRAFRITRDDCTGAILQPLQRCSVAVSFRPQATGRLVARLAFATAAGDADQASVITLSGFGGHSNPAQRAVPAFLGAMPAPLLGTPALPGSTPHLVLRRIVYRRPSG